MAGLPCVGTEPRRKSSIRDCACQAWRYLEDTLLEVFAKHLPRVSIGGVGLVKIDSSLEISSASYLPDCAI